MSRDRRLLRSSARAARIVALLAAAMVVAACSAISGLDGLAFDGSGGAGGASSGSHHGHAGGSVGSGGGAHGEDCLNGKDDDDNGLVDCKDPACGAYACDAAPPPGWLGPIAFYEGADPSVTCPPGFPVRAWVGGAAAAAGQPAVTCSACSCDTTPCGALVATLYADSGCVTAASTTSLQPASCMATPPSPGVRVGRPVIGNEPCNAGGGDVTSRQPPLFSDHAIGCASPTVGKGCGAGVCAPKTSQPFGRDACIYQAGTTSCPAGYTKQTVVMTHLDDSRGCNACTCGPAKHNCNIEVNFYSDAACAAATGSVAANICFSPSGPSFIEVVETSPCNANGGESMGSVDAIDPVTVCCP